MFTIYFSTLYHNLLLFGYILKTLSLIIINMFLFFLGITMTVGFDNDFVPMEIAG